VYKLRLSKSLLPENTPEAIRAALLSLNFARRGFTLEEERRYVSQEVSVDPEHVYFQVDAETNAGFIAESSSDDENPADTQGSSRPRPSASIVTINEFVFLVFNKLQIQIVRRRCFIRSQNIESISPN
jgi:hypothetical protein